MRKRPRLVRRAVAQWRKQARTFGESNAGEAGFTLRVGKAEACAGDHYHLAVSAFKPGSWRSTHGSYQAQSQMICDSCTQRNIRSRVALTSSLRCAGMVRWDTGWTVVGKFLFHDNQTRRRHEHIKVVSQNRLYMPTCGKQCTDTEVDAGPVNRW